MSPNATVWLFDVFLVVYGFYGTEAQAISGCGYITFYRNIFMVSFDLYVYNNKKTKIIRLLSLKTVNEYIQFMYCSKYKLHAYCAAAKLLIEVQE